MATRKVKTRLTLSELRRLLLDFPGIIAGTKNDIRGIRKAYWSGFANSMFNDIQVAYDLKANLETDELEINGKTCHLSRKLTHAKQGKET